ncbi:surface protease GP63 [Trypanosoma cruzi]|nr:surface protease GP63 [Trypanosoma cruzi]
MRADSTNWIRVVVRDAPFLSSWCAAAIHRHWEGWMPIRINVSTRDLDDTMKYCISERYHAMNSLNGNCESEGDVVSSAHGIILENEVVPAAFKLHADHLLVRPLEGPLIVPPFATGSVCIRFTVRAGIVPLVLPMLAWCCAWQSAVGGGALDDRRDGCKEAPRLRRH